MGGVNLLQRESSGQKGVYNIGPQAIMIRERNPIRVNMKIVSAAATVLLLLSLAGAQQPPKPSSPDDLRFLIGEREGIGEGGPGSGKGVFSFAFDLQNKAIVRKNYAEYPSTASRSAIRHDDLIVIYLDCASNQIIANYFDSEGQQITYMVTPSSDREAVTFLSEPSASQPRYRLSYAKLKDGALSGKFEIAPPGQSDAFKEYLEWIARKKMRNEDTNAEHNFKR
jgi:hypothetical protein